MKRFLVAMAMMSLAVAAWAQQEPGQARGIRGQQMYDPSRTETITGQVVEVKEFTSRNGITKGAVLILKTGDKTVTVHLGPQSYLQEQPVKISAGDTVEVSGVKNVHRGQEVYLAGQVKKGAEVLKLRDETGRPLWAGNGMRSGKPVQKAPVGC